MIVKNEEEHLARALDSIKNIATEIIVVDTGSIDKSVEIAKRYTTNVFEILWPNDFSKARNESIKHATCDLIMWMDADEVLTTQGVRELEYYRNTLNPKDEAILSARIRSYTPTGDRYSNALRIFTNHHGIYFSGVVHEQPTGKSAKLIETKIVFHHYGYNLDKDAMVDKNNRNLSLLRRYVLSDPNNAYAHFTYAQSLALDGQLGTALDHFAIASSIGSLDGGLEICMSNMMSEIFFKLGEYHNSKRFAEASVESHPTQIAGYYLLYRNAVKKKDYPLALNYMTEITKQKSAKADGGYKLLPLDIDVPTERVEAIMSELISIVNGEKNV